MFVSRWGRASTWTSAVGLVTLGCGPQIAVPSADESGDTTVTPGTTRADGPGIPPDTSAGEDVTTVVDPTGIGTTDGGGGTTSGTGTDTDDTTGDAGSVCDPQPELFGAAVTLEVRDELDLDAISIDAPCTVDEVVVRDATVTSYVLRCEEPGGEVARTIEIYADPPVDSGVGVRDTLGVRVERQIGIDGPGYEHVTVRDAEGELVAAMYGRLDQPAGFDPDEWFQPFAFELTMDVCRPEPYEPPPGGSFIVDPCPDQTERGAFAVSSPWGEALVYDGARMMLGEYDVRVVFARHVIPQEDGCGGPYDVGRIVLLRDG